MSKVEVKKAQDTDMVDIDKDGDYDRHDRRNARGGVTRIEGRIEEGEEDLFTIPATITYLR